LNLSARLPVKELGLIGGVAARVNGAGLQALARDRRVKYVSPDREVGATLQHAIPAVNANVAQAAGFDGRGIGIAVIDSGVNDHFDLTEGTCGKSRVVYRQNFATGDPAAEVTRMRSWPGSSGSLWSRDARGGDPGG
jgi:serine protease AprX